MPELMRVSELMNPRQVAAPVGGGPDPDPAACEIGALDLEYPCQMLTGMLFGVI